MAEINVVVVREMVVTIMAEMQTMTVVEMKMVTVIGVMIATTKPKSDMVNLVSRSLFRGTMIDTHTNLSFPRLC